MRIANTRTWEESSLDTSRSRSIFLDPTLSGTRQRTSHVLVNPPKMTLEIITAKNYLTTSLPPLSQNRGSEEFSYPAWQSLSLTSKSSKSLNPSGDPDPSPQTINAKLSLSAFPTIALSPSQRGFHASPLPQTNRNSSHPLLTSRAPTGSAHASSRPSTQTEAPRTRLTCRGERTTQAAKSMT